MREIEETIIREYSFEENFKRMRNVKKNFKIARLFNVFFNIGVLVFSFAYIYLWLTYTNAGIKKALILDEEIGTIIFPGPAVTLFAVPAILIMSHFADTFLIKKLNIISQIIYVLIFLFALTNLIFAYEPMKLLDKIILIAYSAAGIWTQDFAVRSYKELDFLKTQEGFPDFNFAMEYKAHSRFIKYRERWLKQEKKLDYFTDNERPIQDYNIFNSRIENEMEGIGIEEERREEWFKGKKINPETKQGGAMEHLEIVSSDLSDDDYADIFDSPRKKPL